jgi:nickel-dependent lactate racemase
MNSVQLKYGSEIFSIDLTPNMKLLEPELPQTSLNTLEIQTKIAQPFGSQKLSALAKPAKNALIVVPDFTRIARCDLVLPAILQTLAESEIERDNISFIIASGTHRAMSGEEIACITGIDVANNYLISKHDCHNQRQLQFVTKTSRGTEAFVNKAVFQHDLVITLGVINAHYFAGFGGGRKMIFPGLAGRQGIIDNHLLSIDFKKGQLAEGITPCNLLNNPVHDDMLEIVSHCPPHFSVNTFLTDDNQIADLFAGDWLAAHRAAAQAFMNHHTVNVEEKFDAIIASCGGYPKDTDLVQAHKSLFHASIALKPGGKLLLLAECRDGLGAKGFENHFPITNAKTFCEKLRTGQIKNGQTALSIHNKSEQYQIGLLTALPQALSNKMNMKRFASFEQGLHWLQGAGSIGIIPKASLTIPTNM